MLKNKQTAVMLKTNHERKFALNTSAVDVCWALIAKIWQELFLSVVYWRLLLYSNPNPNSKNPLATTKLFRVVWTKKGPPHFFFQPIWVCFYILYFQWIGCVNSVNLKLILE